MSTGAILDHVAADQATEGSQIEYRGWRGRLTTGVNPFGTSGRERCIVHDRWGIRYLHDPVSDLVFCSPRFSQESLEACYQSPTAHTDVRTFENFDRALWESSRRRSYLVSRLKMNLINRYLSPGARVLDVGCHMGLFVLLCQEAGYDARGMDVSAPAIETGIRSVGAQNLRVAMIESADVEPESIDGLVIWDVLEHLYNLMEVMQACADAIKPGGYFFAQIPNHRGLSARLKTIAARIGLTGGKFNHFGFPWHLYHFSPRSLDLLMQRVGLKTVEIASVSHRSKLGQMRGPFTRFVERMALSDYLYVVARKETPACRRLR